jgi:hypothetical protein
LIDKGFVGAGGGNPSPGDSIPHGARKLNLNNLNGTLDLGESRLNLNIGGSV